MIMITYILTLSVVREQGCAVFRTELRAVHEEKNKHGSCDNKAKMPVSTLTSSVTSFTCLASDWLKAQVDPFLWSHRHRCEDSYFTDICQVTSTLYLLYYYIIHYESKRMESSHSMCLLIVNIMKRVSAVGF